MMPCSLPSMAAAHIRTAIPTHIAAAALDRPGEWLCAQQQPAMTRSDYEFLARMDGDIENRRKTAFITELTRPSKLEVLERQQRLAAIEEHRKATQIGLQFKIVSSWNQIGRDHRDVDVKELKKFWAFIMADAPSFETPEEGLAFLEGA